MQKRGTGGEDKGMTGEKLQIIKGYGEECLSRA